MTTCWRDTSMTMRYLIDILNESYAVQYVKNRRDDDIEVLINPTRNELIQMAEADVHRSVRVMRFAGKVYAFPASQSTHDFMAIELNLPWRYLRYQDTDQFKLHGKNLKSIHGNDVSPWFSRADRISEAGVMSAADIYSNSKVVLPTVYRGVEKGTDAQRAIRMFKGGDLGDGVYVTPKLWLAKTYGGGPNGKRVAHAYTVDPLFPEDVAYLFGDHEVQLVTGNGIEIYRGEWSGEHLEAALRHTGITVVIGTPKSIGINQIAIREPSLLHPVRH